VQVICKRQRKVYVEKEEDMKSHYPYLLSRIEVLKGGEYCNIQNYYLGY